MRFALTGVLMLVVLQAFAEGADDPQPPAIIPEISIDQAELMAGKYSFRKVMESGRHLFTTPFTPQDGAGEGGKPDPADPNNTLHGPREKRYDDNLNGLINELGLGDKPDKAQILREALALPLSSQRLPNNTSTRSFPLLRLNGLDSQSCFECHNSIGSRNTTDTFSQALTRRPGVNGGPAGFASTAFINDDLPRHTVTFLRNPPHVFGTGYAQKLAEEMTWDLCVKRAQVIGKAFEEAISNPGKVVEEEMVTSNGVNYGKLKASYKPPMPGVQLQALNVARNASGKLVPENGKTEVTYLGLTLDFSEVKGVSYDLVVRPFQWKGIASDERNFVRDAMKFHFGMLAQEIEKSPDFDDDGVENEVTKGNISALTVFTTMIRPPEQQYRVIRVGETFEGDLVSSQEQATKATEKVREQADRGRKIFEGQIGLSAENSCAACHTPSLKIADSMIFVRDPKDEAELIAKLYTGLSSKVKSSADLPVMRRINGAVPAFQRQNNQFRMAGQAQEKNYPKARAAALVPRDASAKGYIYDLSLKNISSLPISYPRLPESVDGSIEVPLFSDLRRHKMGTFLEDRVDQETDAAGVFVPKSEFLTRPLWGMADTGPWMHDGRALTLMDAVMMHESEGSEASPSIEAFRLMPADERQAVIEFLLTIRLPIEERFKFAERR